MTKLYIRNILTGLSFIIVLSSAIMSASGPGTPLTNAPGENNCTSCHNSSLITSGNSNLSNLRFGSNFTGNGYLPDSTYTLELTFKQTSKSKFGFMITCLDKSNNMAGTFTNANSRTSKFTSGSREYIQHTSTGTTTVGTDSTRWTFTWKAPSSNIGTLKFYVVVMAANGNSTNDAGDIVYGKVFDIAPSSLLPVAKASTNDSVTCVGYNVQLNGSGTNSPTSYSWKLLNGTPNGSTSQNPTVVYTLAGTKQAILTVRNSKGVSQPDTINIQVNASPAAIITPSTLATICQGDSLQISANSLAGASYLWTPVNKTSRNIFVKDTGNYQVKVTSGTNQCSRTSAPFKLNWYKKPTISITKTSSKDTVCESYNETFTASGTDIDSVLWYVDGILVRRTKTLSTTFTGSAAITVHAVGKSINGCRSLASNTLRMVTVPKLYPSNILFSKTTSTISMNWKKANGITAYQYSINNVNFFSTTTDSTLELSGLQPNTTYNVVIRSIQSGPCNSSEVSTSVKTNACSNLNYSIDFDGKTCKGNQLTAVITKLYAASYSVSYNGSAYGQDTVFTFTPISSDTLTISIIDSLSPTCPPLIEKLAYTVDTLFDKDTASGAKSVSSCVNTYTMTLPTGYTTYAFYRNNILQSSGALPSFLFTGLSNGDKLTAIGKINSCSRTYGPVSFTLNPTPDAGFSFTRNWKIYNFTADDNSHSTYLWKTGSDVLGNSAAFSKDMNAYSNSNIDVVLIVENSASCKDSSTQNITVPNFSGIKETGNGSFKLYPNPFGSSLSIESKTVGFEAEIIDNLGRVIYSAGSTENILKIDAENWSDGVYYIRIKDAEGNFSNFTIIRSR